MADSSISPKSPQIEPTRQGHLRSVAQLAGLLNHLEVSDQPMHAGQYRMIASRLHELLAQLEAGDDLNYVLAACPAASDIYENLRYEQAGLCLQGLPAIAKSEQATRDVLDRIAAL